MRPDLQGTVKYNCDRLLGRDAPAEGDDGDPVENYRDHDSGIDEPLFFGLFQSTHGRLPLATRMLVLRMRGDGVFSVLCTDIGGGKRLWRPVDALKFITGVA
ncbi:unnamed protein product [Schistocephalus solidus]|uniref:S9 family peptidase n=1 Tax=Schistocephalus solidus TaxID=70667 RepID=A0A183SDF4_SCHSO|nr:unnamed protein product [Schistocephalus solidus]